MPYRVAAATQYLPFDVCLLPFDLTYPISANDSPMRMNFTVW
jgi:hypothetical protein